MAVPRHLEWSGVGQTVELTPDDWEVMDIALALVPEARLAALAVRRARNSSVRYPITSTSQIAALLGADTRMQAAGHDMDETSIKTFVAAGELPIENEGRLAAVAFMALKRCTQRQTLAQAIKDFDDALAVDADVRSTHEL